MAGPDLERFVRAQDEGGTYDMALGELRAGRKTTHWMWFVFPQLKGLGRSPAARAFAISDLGEARAYVDHPVLGRRLRQCLRTILHIEGSSAVEVFGSVDAMKLRSCVTLFARAAADEPLFTEALEKFFDGEPDPATNELLARSG